MKGDHLIDIPIWTHDHTEAWLKLNALPPDFAWPHRDKNPDGSERLAPVVPSYQLHKGYGFWLRTTPYFPGLFEAIHAILVRVPEDGAMPTPEELAHVLRVNAAAKAEQLDLPQPPTPTST